jgi:hypothetical protein
MNADHIPANDKVWSTAPDIWGGRHPGSFQISWEGADALDAQVSWEISNDGVNWVTWTGTWADDNTAVTHYSLNSSSGSQIFEVWAWSAAYYRINYDHGTNTTGSLTFRIFRNK